MISIYVSMYVCMYSVVTATSCCVPGAKTLVRWEGRIAFSGSLVEVKAATQSHSEGSAKTDARSPWAGRKRQRSNMLDVI